jgi:hypothetical protein
LTKRIFRPIELGHDTENELDYNVSGKDSFGTLACRSRNEIGEQKMPCLFQLLPKGLYKEKLFPPFQVYSFSCVAFLQNLYQTNITKYITIIKDNATLKQVRKCNR